MNNKQSEKISEVLEFTQRRFPPDKDLGFIDGNCYWFAHILHSQFSYLHIYYDQIPGHFVAGFSSMGPFFDQKGLYHSASSFLPSLSWIKKYDDTWYNRLMRDCKN